VELRGWWRTQRVLRTSAAVRVFAGSAGCLQYDVGTFWRAGNEPGVAKRWCRSVQAAVSRLADNVCVVRARTHAKASRVTGDIVESARRVRGQHLGCAQAEARRGGSEAHMHALDDGCKRACAALTRASVYEAEKGRERRSNWRYAR
jgi:predicted deacetylase